VILEIGIAIGIENETLREELDRDFDPDFDGTGAAALRKFDSSAKISRPRAF
jgi:hypothetical protein